MPQLPAALRLALVAVVPAFSAGAAVAALGCPVVQVLFVAVFIAIAALVVARRPAGRGRS